MPDRHTDTSDDFDGVDFVVGTDTPGTGVGNTVFGQGSGPPNSRAAGLRLRLTLGGGAAILALVTIVARASSQHHEPAHPAPTPSSSAAADSPQPILNPFQLATRTSSPANCPFGTTCSAARTSPAAIAAVRAVFQGSDILASYTWLGVYNGRFGPNLLSRTITARIPSGTLTITVRKNSTGDMPGIRRTADPKITVVTVATSVNGFAVTAELAQHTGRTDPSALLSKLADDPRLLAIR